MKGKKEIQITLVLSTSACLSEVENLTWEHKSYWRNHEASCARVEFRGAKKKKLKQIELNYPFRQFLYANWILFWFNGFYALKLVSAGSFFFSSTRKLFFLFAQEKWCWTIDAMWALYDLSFIYESWERKKAFLSFSNANPLRHHHHHYFCALIFSQYHFIFWCLAKYKICEVNFTSIKASSNEK